MGKRLAPNRIPLNVSLPPDLFAVFNAFCEGRLLSPSKVVEKAIAQLLAAHKDDEP